MEYAPRRGNNKATSYHQRKTTLPKPDSNVTVSSLGDEKYRKKNAINFSYFMF
jgi:hypothetical protein